MLGILIVLGVVASSSCASAYEALYAANQGGLSVYQYALQSGGSLARASSIAKTTERPDRLVISPDHKSLYVAEGATMGVGAVLQYTIEPDGTLAAKQPAKVPADREIEALAISPDGTSVYAIEGGFFGDGQLARYSVGAGGVLSPTGSPKVTTGDQPNDIVVSPDGRSVYVSNWLESTISQYSVQADGSLAPMSTPLVATGPQPYRLAISLGGHDLYVTDEHFIVEPPEPYEGWVSQFTIQPDGSLTPKVPAKVPAGPEPKGIVISPSGSSAYVADSTETGRISQFAIGSNGVLEPLTPAAVSAGRQPFEMAISLDGTHLYATNSAENTIGQYQIGGDGTLTAMAQATVRAGQWPASIGLVQTEREPVIGPEEPEESHEPPSEHCYEPPPWRCPEPEPPYCPGTEPPGTCCYTGPIRAGSPTPPVRCCPSGPGEVEPLVIVDGCVEVDQGQGPASYQPHEDHHEAGSGGPSNGLTGAGASSSVSSGDLHTQTPRPAAKRHGRRHRFHTHARARAGSRRHRGSLARRPQQKGR